MPLPSGSRLFHRGTRTSLAPSSVDFAESLAHEDWYDSIKSQLERSAAKAEAFTYLTELNPAVDDAPQLQYPSDVFFLSQIAELRNLHQTNQRKFRIVVALLALAVVLVLALIGALIAVLVVVSQSNPCTSTDTWVIESQQSLDSFNKQGCTTVQSVVLQGTELEGVVSLPRLQSAAMNVTVRGMANVTVQFPAMTTGQGVFVEVTDQTVVEFPVLRNVHIIAMASNRALCVYAPRLEQTDTMLVTQNTGICMHTFSELMEIRQLSVSMNDLPGFAFPKLQYVDILEITFNILYSASRTLSMPALDAAGDIFLFGNQQLKEVALGNLTRCREFAAVNNVALTDIRLDALQNASIVVGLSDRLKELRLDKLASAGNLFFYGINDITNLSFPELKESQARPQSAWMRWAVSLNSALEDESAPGTSVNVSVIGAQDMTDLTDFSIPALEKADEVMFVMKSSGKVRRFDIPSASVATAMIVLYMDELAVLAAPELTRVDLVMVACNPRLRQIVMPRLQTCTSACYFQDNPAACYDPALIGGAIDSSQCDVVGCTDQPAGACNATCAQLNQTVCRQHAACTCEDVWDQEKCPNMTDLIGSLVGSR